MGLFGMSLENPNPLLKLLYNIDMGLLYWGFYWIRKV
jgi:hypothetical protein